MQPTNMEGILQQFNPSIEVKLAHGVRLVDLDCLVAQVEPRGDLLVAVALRDQTQHFRFTIAQHGDTSGAFASVRGERRRKMMGQCGIDVLLTDSGSSNRSKQLDV